MAAVEFSFDVVSKVDLMEVKNALGQAEKELASRYDLKGSKCEILTVKDDTTLIADDEFKMDQLKDIVFSKLLKRGIDSRSVKWEDSEPGAGISIRVKMTFTQGIEQKKAKELVKEIKATGVKVNAQIQGEEVRVSAKSKDDLQKAMAAIKAMKLDYPVDFTNYR